jgi:hypothetical protein
MADRKNSRIQLAVIMLGLFPHDSLYQNILGEAYFAEGRYLEAQEQFRGSLERDNGNSSGDLLLPVHKVYCVACGNRIQGLRWKCLDNACSKYDWCGKCMRVRRSVGGLCSHDRVMSIPSKNRVRSLCRIFEPDPEG